MNRGRRFLAPASGLTGSAAEAATKPNRLRRSSRRTEQTQTTAEVEPPWGQQTEFKTPTRIPTSRAGADFSGESPHNDSDCQQDIIWDATSPSPNRFGKRGKKQPHGVVNISEIVSRIAPKHGRPRVAEPTLQQWIGDSAAIPCTPDVQAPKPKKKSPRPNGVDDLLKLAKQFDFNMFRQDGDEVEDVLQQSLELLSGDLLDLENGDQNDFSSSFSEKQQPAAKAVVGKDVQVQLDLQMEDDFDFLFDGPTQHASRNLSQESQAIPASRKASSEAPGVSKTNFNSSTAKDDFEDDWENDDLLNDSFVLEMTQDPHMFSAPKHCSTQKPSFEGKQQRWESFQASRQRSTFKLESNPNFSVRRTETNTWTNSKVDHSLNTAGKDSQPRRLPSFKGDSGSHLSSTTTVTAKPDPQKQSFNQKTWATSVRHTAAATTTTHTSAAKPAPSFSHSPLALSSHNAPAAVSDLLQDDLNSFFASDPVWDDLAEDDLLCEMCEEVENQIQSTEKHVLPMSVQRAPLQPVIPSQENRENRSHQKPSSVQQPPHTSLPRRAGSLHSGGFVPDVAAVAQMKTDSIRYTQHKHSSGSTGVSERQRANSRIESRPQGSTQKDQFTFKRPTDPVSTVTRTVVGKCSAAEIELKKQQALERRRQRLQASKKL